MSKSSHAEVLRRILLALDLKAEYEATAKLVTEIGLKVD